MNTGDLHIACIQQSWKQTIYLSVSNPVIPSIEKPNPKPNLPLGFNKINRLN